MGTIGAGPCCYPSYLGSLITTIETSHCSTYCSNTFLNLLPWERMLVIAAAQALVAIETK